MNRLHDRERHSLPELRQHIPLRGRLVSKDEERILWTGGMRPEGSNAADQAGAIAAVCEATRRCTGERTLVVSPFG